MKRTMLLIGLVLAAGVINSEAQGIFGTNSFLGNLWSWGTSPNTNLSWANTSLEIGEDVKQVNLADIANQLRIQYDFANGINLGVDGEFYAFGTPFNVVEGQAGYAVVQYYSLKVDGDLCAGYDHVVKCAIIEPKVLAENKITEVTFADCSISIPWRSKGTFDGTPSFTVGVGFCIDRTAAQAGSGIAGLKIKLFNLVKL